MLLSFHFPRIFLIVPFLLICAGATFAQTTQFTYQGRFTDTTVPQPTNGTYSMHFALFDAVSGGNPSGAIVDIPAVQVVNGIFTVRLDYTAAAFDGNARFLQITVGNTPLSPRQEITSAPYAIMARNALRANHSSDSDKLGGIDADQYVSGQVVNNVNNLSGNVTLAPGANITITPTGNTLTIASTTGSGINNQTSVQTTANFNIDGVGAANAFNAATQFNIGGNRVLSVGSGNLFAGVAAGASNTTGGDNAYVGTNSGMTSTSGFNNSFFGTDAGRNNLGGAGNSFFGRSSGYATTSGNNNSFFGLDSGRFNTTGANNAFFGHSAGSSNTTGTDNSYFGLSSGFSNTQGSNNVFVGRNAGQNNTLGNTNSFFGNFAGFSNTTGSNNSALGNSADFSANNLNYATAIGAGSLASNSNTIVLGRANGNDSVIIPGLGAAAGGTALCRNASNQISSCAAGSFGGSFIMNSNVQQPTSNFNISGGGTIGGTLSANVVNSQTNFSIGGATVFSSPNQTSVVAGQFSNHNLQSPNNSFFGYKAGQSANGFSQANTFIGSEAGETTTSGGNNVFVGTDTGFFNTSGSQNSFFGNGAGQTNSTANANSFFGYFAGHLNSTGTRNSFFGFQAGQSSGSVNDNTFFGYQAGSAATGGKNTFVGSSAGLANTTGSQNTFVGNAAGNTGTVGFSNSLFGYSVGASGSENVVSGVNANSSGNKNTVLGNGSAGFGDNNTIVGYNAKTIGGTRNHSTALGADAQTDTDNTVVLGTLIDTVVAPNLLKSKNITVELSIQTNSVVASFGKFDELQLTNTPLGITPMCLDSMKRIGICQSSLNGKTEAVRTTAIADTFEKQQTQIAAQAEQIKQQQAQIETLEQIVCEIKPTAKMCGKQN